MSENTISYFLTGFAGQGVVRKDTTVWLDGARLTPEELLIVLNFQTQYLHLIILN
jgi:hypothetical protein